MSKKIKQVHNSKLSKLQKIAVWTTNHVGTIEFFIVCNLMVASTLIFPKVITVIQFISSAWLQLVLLPLILIGQNIQSKHSEKLAEHTYELVKKIDRLLEHHNIQ